MQDSALAGVYRKKLYLVKDSQPCRSSYRCLRLCGSSFLCPKLPAHHTHAETSNTCVSKPVSNLTPLPRNARLLLRKLIFHKFHNCFGCPE